MRNLKRAGGWVAEAILAGCMAAALGQAADGNPVVTLSVVDENGAAVQGAEVTVEEPGQADVRLVTDYAGKAVYAIEGTQPYRLRVTKPGFYQTVESQADPANQEMRAILSHEQMVLEQVSVTSSAPGIDVEQASDKRTMNLPEIINIPYTTSRDIRNLLPFYPGVVQDATGQVHIDGSETWATLDTLDGFDIRSPVSGMLAMRVSTDAVRSIDEETTRYPVEFGRATGGVMAFYSGMGDNKFRFNATDFLPSFRELNGIRFDKFVPRVTFMGPLRRNRAWFFDGVEAEYDNIYIVELPQGADSNHLLRGSNLIRAQANLTPANILSGGLLFNDYHSPYEGISPLVPQQATTKRDTIAWMPYARNQHSFGNGALLDAGIGVVHFRDGYEPHGNSPYQITPEQAQGSYFENLTSRSQREEANVAFYLPPARWRGLHNLKTGIDVDHIGFDERVTRAPVNYLREDGTLLRQSTFPATAPFTRHNVEAGAYIEDRWMPGAGVTIGPGVRFDWDEVIRRPLVSPRLTAIYAPARAKGNTKVEAGIGLYYEHTQLEYLERALAGIREDTYYAADGLTPLGPPQQTAFTAPYGPLREARAVNWSVGLEQKLPGLIFLRANVIRKRVTDQFTYVNQSGAAALAGNYLLTNGRKDDDNLFEIEARRTFAHGYALFGAYTHATARTNAAIDYVPTVSMLGPQQSGPLGWDTPNRVISWGWLPFDLPWFRKRTDFVYALDWHTGFPYTAVDANQQVVGTAGAYRYPHFVSFSPGLEWRFHFRGEYFGLRGVIENATNARDPAVVNNDVDSPQFGVFSEYAGRALTARLRLIGSK